MTIIDFKNVDLIRNKRQILSNISWQVNQGEHWAILGLNGSGKTSLLKLILAEEWKTKGSISVLGTEFGKGEIPKLRRRVSVVGSYIAERFTSTIKSENVVYTGKFNSSMLYKFYTDKELDEARELLRTIGAEALIGRAYGSLSQGEKQILLIARSLILQPDILILDEATNGLDLFAKEKFLSYLHHIIVLDNSPTVIYITHHSDEITDDFSHLLLLRKGTIVKQGDKNQLLTKEVLSDFYERAVELHRIGHKIFVIPTQ